MQTEPSLHLGDYASLFYNASHSGQMCFIGITQLFGAIVLKGIFKVNLMKNKRAQSTFSIPKTVVFYRNFEICMLHVSLSPVLSTLNILGARFPFKTMILSHTELFSFFLSFFKTSTVKSQLGEENWKLLLFISLTDIHHLHFFFPSRSLVFIALIDESALTFDLCCLLGKHWMLMRSNWPRKWCKNVEKRTTDEKPLTLLFLRFFLHANFVQTNMAWIQTRYLFFSSPLWIQNFEI